MKKKTLITFAGLTLGGLFLVAAGAGAAWWQLRPASSDGGKEAATKQIAAEKAVLKDAKYVSLEKVIVMLRNRENEAATRYMAIDLVFRTDPRQEKAVREQLPFLRSIALRHLAGYTADKAGAATVDELTADINEAYGARYRHDDIPMPFTDVMIGKLIIE